MPKLNRNLKLRQMYMQHTSSKPNDVKVAVPASLSNRQEHS